MEEVFIVGAGRSAIGKFGGSLSKIPAAHLAAQVITGVLENIRLSVERIDEVILGQVLTTGVGQNAARQASIIAQLPHTIPAMTINKVCGSGLKAVQLGAQAIRCHDADLVIVGGQENMSLAPHYLPTSRQGQRMGDWALKDSMIVDGLWDAFHDYHMGKTAENIASQFKISREAQDEFAAQSQQKAAQAMQEGRFKDEIIPISILKDKTDRFLFQEDEGIRPGTNVHTLSHLRPAFSPTGTVSAGNSAGINDGAAIIVLANKKRIQECALTPWAKIIACATSGVEPAIMGTGPIIATRRCLEKAQWHMSDLDLIEANEAFAAQAICVNRQLEWDLDKVNVNGGAIALGHPIGASGARILVTLLHEMRRRNVKKGLATLCIGGGQGIAIAIETVF